MAQATHLFISVAKGRPMQEVEEVLAEADKGFLPCLHGRPGSKRQVLLMDRETLRTFGLEPGDVKENITTEGLSLAEMKAGQRLRIGEALLEITISCTPCDYMDELREGLQEEIRGRRGMMCRVIESGLIRRGDTIEALEVAEAVTTNGENA